MALVRTYLEPNCHPHSDKWIQTDGTDAEKDHMDVKRNRETVNGKTQK